MTPISDTLRATVTAMCATPLAPGQSTALHAQHPELGWLESCCNQQALAGDAFGVQRLARSWLRAWQEAVDTLEKE